MVFEKVNRGLGKIIFNLGVIKNLGKGCKIRENLVLLADFFNLTIEQNACFAAKWCSIVQTSCFCVNLKKIAKGCSGNLKITQKLDKVC